MTTWEYRVETTEIGNNLRLDKMTSEWLNELGRDGWELVSINTTTGAMGRVTKDAYLVFKRPS